MPSRPAIYARLLLVIFAVLFGSSGVGRAAPDGRDYSVAPAPRWVVPLSATSAVEHVHGEADTGLVDVFIDDQIRVGTTLEHYLRRVRRVTTLAGVEQAGELEIVIDPAHGRIGARGHPCGVGGEVVVRARCGIGSTAGRAPRRRGRRREHHVGALRLRHLRPCARSIRRDPRTGPVAIRPRRCAIERSRPVPRLAGATLASSRGVAHRESMFCRYSLRTIDLEAARAFYGEVVGLDFSVSPDVSGLEAWTLHEQARARGAPSHWLGQLAVADVEATVSRLLELGAERLGPTVKTPEGASYATLRDPTGAVVAVRGSTPPPERTPVVWHHLHTRDLERTWKVYAELVGWRHTETVDASDVEGGFRIFAWERSGGNVGSVANTARRPGVHTHWLFYFPVADLDGSLALVRAKGGRAPLSPVTLPNGERIAPCDDPQGAAFGLLASPRRP